MRLLSAIETATRHQYRQIVREERESYLESIIIRLEDLLEVDKLSQFWTPDSVPVSIWG